MSNTQHDLILVGGGLASCLTAYRLKQLQPQLDVVVLEQGPRLGGNHTWSFFPTDLTPAQLQWIDPLIRYRWDNYEVRFPRLRRQLTSGYCSTDSEHFHAVMTAELDSAVRLNTEVVELREGHVQLANGDVVRARCVVDGRGPEPAPQLALGFQKFTGQVVKLREPHALAGPIIMDATVPQGGDYRFLYTLPLGADELLIEDTRYSNSPVLNSVGDTIAIAEYAAAQAWQVADVVRDERGVLPITLAGDIDAFWSAHRMPRIGLRAALFHATTGYSFADAVRTADAVADSAASSLSSTRAMFEFVMARSKAHWQAQGYWRFLNRMLFLAAAPERRHLVMQRFYGLKQPLIERFYAGSSTLADKARILSGKPPVSIAAALRCLPPSSALGAARVQNNNSVNEEVP